MYVCIIFCFSELVYSDAFLDLFCIKKWSITQTKEENQTKEMKQGCLCQQNWHEDRGCSSIRT